ncbi:MAG: FAD-binding oxidoreductase, partial [Prevotella melaninogenica]
MNKIIRKQQFSEKVFCLEVEAPLIARSCRPGNFIIVRVDNHSERVPYTIAKSDPVKGTLTMVIQEVGRSSTKLCQLNEGDEIVDIVGPLGTPSHIENYGTIICAGGGIGFKGFWDNEAGFNYDFFHSVDPDLPKIVKEKCEAPIISIGESAGRL